MAKDKLLDPQDAEPLGKPIVQGRLTLVVNLHHDHRQGDPVAIPIVKDGLLEHDEQPWQRRVKIGEQWTPLDLGWFTDETAGMLVIENQEGRNPARIPTPEERAETAAKVIEIALEENPPPDRTWTVAPGWPHIGTPAKHSRVFLRCRKGEAWVKIHVIPS